ncbi:amino acid ABC transporter membrane protein 2, PAAT family [Pedococcus dokdonensis]|uniref:Amino acid ABC transporter membrane protein 2, PAAT family n=1 Tax=Pedococcus dokdonensis TaxID=443156 RepID=A0A1H0PZJ5_9MICO|nr:amino acid ABC transporter permease [Pedococcus dokdonensis]SDP10484.1 amino acid ABC transporter membrane protein 2, PAAT family [Pedococcus dokdonensis]
MSAAVLFDAPGPRARRRHALLAVLGALLLVVIVVVVLRKMQSAGQLDPALWKPFITDRSVWRDYLVKGLWATLKAAAISIVFAGVFGILLGLGRLSQLAPLRWLCGVVVEFFRAVPVLLMMIFAYFGIYTRSDLFSAETAPLAAVVTGLTLYNGSVIAELVRSGIFALPKGQSEAGLSIGLTPSQTLRSIQLPQALTAMLPALIGQFVVVLKDSALGYQVLYQELLTWSKTLGSAFSNTVPAYIVCGVLFILINYSLSKLAGLVQRRLSQRGRATVREATAVPAATGSATST